jgi:hypothetical protein
LALADPADLVGWPVAVAVAVAGMAAAAEGLTGMTVALMVVAVVADHLLQTQHLSKTPNIRLVFVVGMGEFDLATRFCRRLLAFLVFKSPKSWPNSTWR